MASSRFSSNNPDWLDLTAIIKAFEEMNKCHITLHGRVESVNGLDCLSFLVAALDSSQDLPEVVFLASQRCHLGLHAHKTMESAIMWALYQLDWQLAEDEMRKPGKTA